MASVRKSPNIMSTTGCMPVMAAPTPSPVKPGSEMGVSMTWSLPNSSTSPDKTLNGVPASATSSPRMKTRVSRRISSASASRMASPKVSSRSGIDVLPYFFRSRERRIQGELHSSLYFLLHIGLKAVQHSLVGELLGNQPPSEDFQRIALRPPLLLFLFGAIIRPADVSHMVPVVPVCPA